MSPEEMQTTLMGLKRRTMAQKKLEQQLAAKHLAEGQTFLAENAKKDGVVSLRSGLQYKVIKEGTGKAPGLKDTVSVNYRGTLIDGTEFDNSYKRNEPTTFRVDSVIRGWSEALQLMKEGAKWELYIPPELGYGERGAGSKIPPTARLFSKSRSSRLTPRKKPSRRKNKNPKTRFLKRIAFSDKKPVAERFLYTGRIFFPDANQTDAIPEGLLGGNPFRSVGCFSPETV